MARSNFELISETTNPSDTWHDCLDGISAKRKASSYTGHHDTGILANVLPFPERDSVPIINN